MTIENTSPNPGQISLNLSGGIALGAYMAGVCFELVRQARKDNSPLLIDLITGASAGAMTGAITAYYLLNREITDPEYESQNLLQRAWVEKADMKDIDTVFAIEDYRQVLKNLLKSQNESLLSQKRD
jgi:Predicted esterase of the alpha-beta hydrolase superfamily